MRRYVSLFVLVCAVWLMRPPVVLSYNNTSLKWKTIETEHFRVHFHQGAEWTAREAARVAEEVYPHITSLYGYEPKRVHIIIKDSDDYANGAAYYYDNKIEIWATNLEFGFRGTSRWIRNVVTHEFTHIVSIQACMKLPLRMPAVYFQWIDFEKEKRSDVLTGYPSHISSYALAGAAMPPWFAEGVAQYQSPMKQYDCWDSHRDMILRCAVLEDKLLTYDQLGFFGKNGMEAEQVYDHGYSFVRHIASHYGPESLKEITEAMQSWTRLTMDGSLKKVTGKSGRELYEEWREALRRQYESQAGAIEANLRAGRVLAKGGYFTTAPEFSPDGERVVFLSNKGSDFSRTSLYTIDRDGENRKFLKGGVSSRAAFSSDGQKLVYSRTEKVDRYGSEVNDLFTYDLGNRKEKRLTRGLRASDPHFSPDGKRIVCVLNSDGTHRVALMDADGGNVQVILSGEKGTQFYTPRFSPNGERILFGIFNEGTRDIAVISPDGSGLSYVLRSPNDERDARWVRGDRGIVFSSDRGGVFNIYELDLESGRVTQLTNVIGGAFLPDVSPTGDLLAYASYCGEGYRVALLDQTSPPVFQMDRESYIKRNISDDPCACLRNTEVEAKGGETGSGERKQSLYEKADRSAGDEGAPSGTKAASISQAPREFGNSSKSEGKASLEGGRIRASGEGDGTAGRALLSAGDASSASGEATSRDVFEEKPYRSAFTSFQFYPRFIVYDRTPRFGLFMSSSEVLDKQNFFLGASLGTNKEFDAFLIYELRQLYPTLFAEVVRLREFFEDRAIIENDPYLGSGALELKLRYDLWQADFGVRLELEDIYSAVHRKELSLYFTHGEYSVHYDGKFYNNYGEFEFSERAGWKYYIGNEITARYHYKDIVRAVDSDINPRGGREFTFQYRRAFDELFTSGEFEYGFNPVFDKNHYNQYSIQWTEYVALPYLRHSLQLKLYGGVIDKKVDDFFWLYLGGRDGLRGYTYYSIGGRKALLASATYRFPIWRRIDKQFLHLYIRDIYGGIFYEAGNAWIKDKLETRGYEKALGYEIRIAMGSFYTYPTAVSIVAAYPFDEVIFNDPVFGELPVVQKKRWRYYVSVGFAF